MTKWAGWIITLAGIGHTVGSLAETAPDHAETWFAGTLWSETDYTTFSDAATGFWYSAFSFGPPLILLGVIVLWFAHRGITPPAFIAVAIAVWVAITFVASGPSPLLVLLVASGLLLRDARRTTPTAAPKEMQR
ncbi:DUF6463 family protein [Antrihabitans spumae]|jgi:hypothetical protein|uniref:DUF6463 family protein n=1 Tax=Antrihabitans spumae TaxID=3373370 RepID=A0ABW7K5Y9_9NOCA